MAGLFSAMTQDVSSDADQPTQDNGIDQSATQDDFTADDSGFATQDDTGAGVDGSDFAAG